MTQPAPFIFDRNTAAWQELDRQHYLHPFTDYKNLHAKGSRVIVKAEGVYLYDSEGQRILDGMAGLWCVNVGYGRRELAEAAYRQTAGAAVLQQFLPDGSPAGDRAREAAGRPDTAAVQPRVFHGIGLGRQRHRGAHRASLLGPARPTRAQGHHQPPERLPRQHDRRRQPRRHGVHARAGRVADPGHRPHPRSRTGTGRVATCPRRSSA